MQQQTEVAVRAADAVLKRKSKIDQAIAGGVAELQNLILAQLESGRARRKLEAAAAIGEPAPGLEKARKAATEARAALDLASLKLGGLRTALGEMGGDFVERYDELAAEIPKHNASVVSAFEAEWRAALSPWALVLGRRASIERVLGQPLALPDPMPAAVEISPDVAQPAETLAAVGGAIKSLAGFKKIAERQLKASSYRDPHAVYKVISDRLESRGIAKGTLIIAATCEPGRLDQLIELEQVRPILDRDQIPGVTIAALKADQIDQAVRDKELAESEARLHSNVGQETTRRPDLEAQLNYRPTKADLDDIAEKNAQIAGRSSSPGDTSLGAHN